MTYTTITEVIDTGAGPPYQKEKLNAPCIACDQSLEVDESDDEDTSGFTRVQLVSKQRKLKRLNSQPLSQRGKNLVGSDFRRIAGKHKHERFRSILVEELKKLCSEYCECVRSVYSTGLLSLSAD